MLGAVSEAVWDRSRCSVAGTLAVVGEKWSLLVLREAFLGVRRFADFQRALGAPKAVLSDRLRPPGEQGIPHPAPYPAGGGGPRPAGPGAAGAVPRAAAGGPAVTAASPRRHRSAAQRRRRSSLGDGAP